MYRKFSAANIFTGYEILNRDFVLITSAEGVIIDLIHKENAGDGIEYSDGLICPGFINTHCHVELSHLKNAIATGTGLVQFVQEVMSKRILLEEYKLEAMQNAVQEMDACGIVAVGDICNTADALIVKQKTNLRWHNFIEVSGFVDKTAAQRLEAAKIVADTYKQFYTGTSLSPHAPYSVSANLFSLLNIETAQQIISIHNQECAAENELYFSKTGGLLDLFKNFGIDITSFQATGKTSLQSWLPHFNKNQSIISVHNSFTREEDFNFIKQQTVTDDNTKLPLLNFCLCINANKYIEQKIPPIDLLINNNCRITLGTDSYASNWQLNILEEIKALQLATNYAVPLTEILQWATINGARALKMDNELGSFDKGKKPGIVLINNLKELNTTASSKAIRIL